MSDLIQYRCKRCNKTFFLVESELTHSEEESNKITCPYNKEHTNITVTDRYGSIKELKECMEEGQVLKRKQGRLIKARG